MKRLMVTEPWEISCSAAERLLGGGLLKPLSISEMVKADLPLIAAIFSAVLESITDMVTKTPRGKCEVVAFNDHVPLVDQVGGPVESV